MKNVQLESTCCVSKKLKKALKNAGYPFVLSRAFDRNTPSHQCDTVCFGIVKILKDAGYTVVLCTSSDAKTERVQSRLSEFGEGARYYQHNLLEIEKIDDLLNRIEADLCAATSLISNAGGPLEPVVICLNYCQKIITL